jgi:transposase
MAEAGSVALPIPLRAEFDAAGLCAAARDGKNAGQTRRLLALAAVCDGAPRTEAARIGGVTLPAASAASCCQPHRRRHAASRIGGVILPAANASRFGEIVRDRVMRLNAHGAAGLINRKAPGQPRRPDDTPRAALVAAVENGPIPAVHGVVRWRVVELRQGLHDAFEVSVSEHTLSRELRELGHRKLPARPRHHSQAESATEAFKETSPRAWTRSRASRTSIPTTQRSGPAARPGAARRTEPPVAGPTRAPAHPRRTTSARHRPPSSALSARRAARQPG